MRGRLALLTLALLVPTAAAEFGPYDDKGWPLNVDGESTFPGGIVPGGGAPADPLNVVAGVTVYPYWPVLTAEVQRLAREYPDVVKLHSAGKSTLGLDLWMLEIADFARIEEGEGIPLEDREVVWVDGGTHSNEYSGVYFTAHLASFLLDGYGTNETAKWIVENRHSWIMPMVNPDGSNAMGRLNARLVNINRNYPVIWDGEGHDPTLNNRGPAPASEVETQINIEWFNKTQPDYYASVHCCGNLWLYPYGEAGVDPIDNETLWNICDEAFPSVREDCGPIWSTIYPASGSSVDTVYEYTGAAAFGYEMSGRGAISLWGQPFTEASVEEQEIESWTGVLHAFLNVHKYGGYPVVTEAAVDAAGFTLTIENQGYGNISAGNVTIAGVTAPLPFLAPGAMAQVRIDAPPAEGVTKARIDYTKRMQAAPQGSIGVDLAVVRDATGALAVTLIGDAANPLATVGAPAGGLGVPGVAPLVVVVAIAGLAVARRRDRA